MSGSNVWLAGAAEVDITPALGTQIAGNIGVLRPTEKVEQRLFARALVLQQGETRLCYFTSDILAIRTDYAEAIRKEAAKRFQLRPEELVVNCTQNHSSPSVGHCFCLDEAFWRRWVSHDLEWVLGGQPEYTEAFVGHAVTVIGEALNRLQPVTAFASRGIEGRLRWRPLRKRQSMSCATWPVRARKREALLRRSNGWACRRIDTNGSQSDSAGAKRREEIDEHADDVEESCREFPGRGGRSGGGSDLCIAGDDL